MSLELKYIRDIIKRIQNYNPSCFHDQIKKQWNDWIYPNINNIPLQDNLYVWGTETEFTQFYKNYIFQINISRDGNYTIVNIYAHDEEKNPFSCSTVLIDRKSKIGILQSISYYEKRTLPDLLYDKGRSTVLKFVLRFLKRNKEVLDIKRIVLKDITTKICKNCSENIKLPIMYFLLHGNTWYGKYGFRPYDTRENKPDESYLEDYNKNQKIIRKTKVKDTNLFKYIVKAINKYNIKNIDIKYISHILDKRRNKSLSHVLKVIMKKYDKHCCIFTYIFDKLYDELRLQRFYGLPFYLDI